MVEPYPAGRVLARTIVAGAMAPSEASWAALMVLYTAWLRYGTPQT